jgi:hypothetical protein
MQVIRVMAAFQTVITTQWRWSMDLDAPGDGAFEVGEQSVVCPRRSRWVVTNGSLIDKRIGLRRGGLGVAPSAFCLRCTPTPFAPSAAAVGGLRGIPYVAVTTHPHPHLQPPHQCLRVRPPPSSGNHRAPPTALSPCLASHPTSTLLQPARPE